MTSEGKRDFQKEIAEIKERHPETGRALIFEDRIKKLWLLRTRYLWTPGSWDEDDVQCKIEIMRYIPIALVAAIQGYLRLAVRDLVDAGEPFASNARSLKTVRFDHDLVLGLASRKLTLGEIMAHFTYCNRLDDILGTLSDITGTSFPKRLRNLKLKDHLFGDQFDAYAPTVKETFQLRHIFAHELAPEVNVNPFACDNEILICQGLILACDILVQQDIDGAGAVT